MKAKLLSVIAFVSLAASAQVAVKGGGSQTVIPGLPPGVTLSQQGVLSGTPSSAGTYQFAVKACDSEVPQLCGTATFSVTIYDQIRVNPIPLPIGLVNQPYTQQQFTASGGDGNYTWSVQ